MADKIITYEYASSNYSAYIKNIMPSTKQGMTKAKVIEHLYIDESLLSSYTNDRLVPISKVVGMSPINLPSGLEYRFKQQAIINGRSYADNFDYQPLPFSPTSLGEAIRTYTGGVSTTINANNNISNIIADILSFTSAPPSSLTIKRQPLVADGSSEDRIYVLGNRMLSVPYEFSPNQFWKQAINPQPINLTNLIADFLVDIADYQDVDNYLSPFSLYPGGPTVVNLKHFNIEILDGTKGTSPYRNFRAEIKYMPLHLEFFSFGQSIGTATIYFSPVVP